MGSDTTPESASSITLESCSQVWVSGSHGYSDIGRVVMGPGDTLAPTAGVGPVFIVGYDLYGGVVDYKSLGGGGDDQNGIACDPKGNIFMCSDYYGAIRVNTDALSAGGGESFVIAKYSPPPPDTSYTVNDTAACGGITSIILRARPGYSYLWDDGSTLPTRSVSTAGKYYVVCTNCAGKLIVDTTNLTISSIVVPIYKVTDTTVCTPFTSITFSKYLFPKK